MNKKYTEFLLFIYNNLNEQKFETQGGFLELLWKPKKDLLSL